MFVDYFDIMLFVFFFFFFKQKTAYEMRISDWSSDVCSSDLLAKRQVYWALVVGVPSIEDGIIDLPLGKQPGTGGEKMHVDKENGLPARTRYRVIDRAGNRACWLELQPYTGRTHQLRAHLTAIGHPIVGDGKYGGPEAFLSGGISRKMHLHARRIRIDHPDGDVLDVMAEAPRHFAESIAHLGFDLTAGDLPIESFDPDSDPDRKSTRLNSSH